MEGDQLKPALDGCFRRVTNGNATERDYDILQGTATLYANLYIKPVEETKPTEVTVLSGSFPLEGLVTVEQVATFLGIKPNTVFQRVRKGEIPQPVKKEPRCTRWDAREIRESEENRKREEAA